MKTHLFVTVFALNDQESLCEKRTHDLWFINLFNTISPTGLVVPGSSSAGGENLSNRNDRGSIAGSPF